MKTHEQPDVTHQTTSGTNGLPCENGTGENGTGENPKTDTRTAETATSDTHIVSLSLTHWPGLLNGIMHGWFIAEAVLNAVKVFRDEDDPTLAYFIGSLWNYIDCLAFVANLIDLYQLYAAPNTEPDATKSLHRKIHNGVGIFVCLIMAGATIADDLGYYEEDNQQLKALPGYTFCLAMLAGGVNALLNLCRANNASAIGESKHEALLSCEDVQDIELPQTPAANSKPSTRQQTFFTLNTDANAMGEWFLTAAPAALLTALATQIESSECAVAGATLYLLSAFAFKLPNLIEQAATGFNSCRPR